MSSVSMYEHAFEYSQMCVHRKDLAKPFTKWTKRERNQGFAFRKGSVTFLLTSSFGDFVIDVHVGEREADKYSVIVVKVPFEVKEDRSICISSISDNYGDEVTLDVPVGVYSLQYEGFPVVGDEEYDEKQLVKLTFSPMEKPRFELLRYTSDMSPPAVLHTSGEEA